MWFPTRVTLVCAIIVLAVPSFLRQASAQDSRILERIVAVVDKDVVTQGELVAEARLALVMREGHRAAFVQLDEDYVHAFLDHLISQMLVAQEARRMGADGVRDADVTQRMEQLKEHFDSQQDYLRFVSSLAMDAMFVRAVMTRDVQNDRYISERLRTRLLAQGGRPHKATPGQAAAHDEVLRAKALQRWLFELRRAAQVRVLDARGRLFVERR